MPLMGNIYIGSSGLQTSQNALNTVAHNLANSGTVGYTRQQVLLADKKYNTISTNSNAVSNQQLGLGVTYSQVRQVRDYFLDKTYRKEAGRSAFYEESYSTMQEVENLLGELDGATFKSSLGNLWESVEELAKDPSSSVTQGLFIQRASQFLERADTVYEGLSSYQDNLNSKVQTTVDEINEIGKKIFTLNIDIVGIEVGGTESANDLRDQRNALLDDLAKMANISYEEDSVGSVTVKLEGHTFVTSNNVYDISLDRDEDTGFYTPFWTMDAKTKTMSDGSVQYDITSAKVFDLTQTISTASDSDVGSLKAQLLARGDRRANYTDLNPTYYDKEISSSIVMNIQAEFDSLIHNIAVKINEVISNASSSASGYLVDSSGNPIQIFQKISSAGYDSSGVYVPESTLPGDESTLYTISNLAINPDLLKNSSLLGFVKSDDSIDFDTAKKLQAVFETENYTLNPNVTSLSNLVDFYSNMVAQVANSGSVFKSVCTSQETTVAETESARQQVVGVSDDEELSNMIKYQNAYNASSRYINVIDQMLEHIVNTLGA